MWPFRKKRQWPQIPFDEIRRRSRLLVIDDNDFPYETLFRRDGYNLEKWNEVERLTDIEAGKFDLLLLDMQGVGREESAEQGFGLLKHFKKHCPTLIIVAYSNAEFGLKYQEFFSLADGVLPKTADYVEFRRHVDDLLKQRFSLGFFVARIRAELGEAATEVPTIEDLAREAILTGKSATLRSRLAEKVQSAVTVDRVIAIVDVAANLLSVIAAR